MLFDHFETVWTQHDNPRAEAEALASILEKIFGERDQRPRGRVLLSFRKEYLAEVRAMLHTVGLRSQTIDLWPLDRPGIIEAIVGPARLPTLTVEIDDALPGLVADELLEDPKTTIAPALQILLRKLWLDVHGTASLTRLTIERYRALHREGKWVEEYFEAQIEELGKKRHRHSVDSGLVFDLLAFHTTDLGASRSRSMQEILDRYAPRQRREVQALLRSLADLYLIGDPPKHEEQATYRLTHDVLAPIVKRAFGASDRPGQRARRILENRAVEWEEGQKGAPLDDSDLALVEQGLDGMRSLKSAERRLLEASRRAAVRRRRQRRAIQAGSLAAVLAILVAAIVAVSMWLDANTRKTHQLMAQSLNEVDGDFDRALLLSLEAQRQSRTWWQGEVAIEGEAEQHLATVLTRQPRIEHFLHGHEDFVRGIAFSPDGRLLASSSRDGGLVLWDLETRSLRRRLPRTPLDKEKNEVDNSSAVAFSPDGHWLAFGDDGCLRFWDLQTETLMADPALCRQRRRADSQGRAQWKSANVLALAFDPEPRDGHLLAVAWDGHPMILLDQDKGWESIPLPRFPGDERAFGADFDPSGNILAVAGVAAYPNCPPIGGNRSVQECGCLALVDVNRLELLGEPVCESDKTPNDVSFHPGEDQLAVGWRGRALQIWDFDSGRLTLADESVPHTASITETVSNAS